MVSAVIDCNFLSYRAGLGFGGLSFNNSDTTVIFGFLNEMLTFAKEIKSSYKPIDKFIFTWDSRKSFRKMAYRDYKKKEPKSAEDMKILDSIHKQMNILRSEILPAMGFENVLMMTGIEADDIIAKIVSRGEIDNEFIIFSSDADLYQLLSPYCGMYRAKKGLYTLTDFIEEYDITPKEWAEVKAIAGCTSDKLPGIKGIGEKSAIKYIKDLHLSVGMKKKITEGKEIIKRNRPIVTLPHKKTKDVKLKKDVVTPARIKTAFETYGMFSFLKEKRFNEWSSLFCEGGITRR